MKALLTRLFGTDAACGLSFVEDIAEGEPRSWTAVEYDALPDPKPDAYSELPNGGSGVCCTDYARLVAQRLPGRVEIYGFHNEDNPTSRVAREEIHSGGHDFAVVDSRWLVDPWLVLVASEGEQLVFDLLDPTDNTLIGDIYGPLECWSTHPIEEHLKHCHAVAPFTAEELA